MEMDQTFVIEEAKQVPIVHEADLCVLGGSCTGVFAAVRAARLGLKVVIVEKQNCFGGVATISMVNVWHSLLDTEFNQPIIGGLTVELIERLKKRNAVTIVEKSHHFGYVFNSQELKIDLDEIVLEHQIKPYLHTMLVAPFLEEGKLIGVIVENKSGRGVIKAKMFIDATGDGDLCARAGLPCYVANHLQPSTTCASFSGWESIKGFNLGDALLAHRMEYELNEGFVWGCNVPGSDIYMLAATKVHGANCADADALTYSEIEGRRQVRAFMDLINKYKPDNNIVLQGLPSRIGIRESRHVNCQYQLTGEDVLYGKRFEDAIANGSYRVDIHHQDKPGLTFRHLNGVEEYCRPGYPNQVSRWREYTEENPVFYQIPYRSMVPGTFDNLLIAGRMIDADVQAHGAIRVMVNMNQTGEAAGVAAAVALASNKGVGEIDVNELRQALKDGGSIVL
jgi:hypothetical protein